MVVLPPLLDPPPPLLPPLPDPAPTAAAPRGPAASRGQRGRGRDRADGYEARVPPGPTGSPVARIRPLCRRHMVPPNSRPGRIANEAAHPEFSRIEDRWKSAVLSLD